MTPDQRRKPQPPGLFPRVVDPKTITGGPLSPSLSSADVTPAQSIGLDFLSRGVFGAQTPNYPTLPGIGGDLLNRAGRITMDFQLGDSVGTPMPQPAGGAKDDNPWSNVPPVSLSAIDGKSRLQENMKRLFRAQPGETAEQLSKRISAMSELTKNIDKLGNITPDDADAITDSWYRSTMNVPPPSAEFSPEVQQAIHEAYGGNVPQGRIAGASDVNPDEAAAVAAYALTNSLLGKGNFGDLLKGVNVVMGRAQQRVDAQTKALQDADELRRKEALAKLQQVTA